MQDGAESSQDPMRDEPQHPPLAPPPGRAARSVLVTALVAFILGAALAGWLVWRGDLDVLLPDRASQGAASRVAGSLDQQPRAGSDTPSDLDRQLAKDDLGGVETRLALLEERFSRIDQQANAASANASRAEALLIALAARRTIDRGEPLGYIEDQLKLRFGGAQPQAVQTILDAAKQPITLYLLSSQLEAAAPALTGARREESTWTMLRRELGSLFVVRRASSPAATPLDRAERAQVLLRAGRIEDAIAEVERLPGADNAKDWIAAARRYDAAQRALEVIETTAMLEPRELRDAEGRPVNQPSPLALPADKAMAAK